MKLALVFVILHWFTYVVASICLTVLCAEFMQNRGSLFNLSLVSSNGLARVQAMIALASMAGVPPFLGFWTKLFMLLHVGGSASAVTLFLCWFFILFAIVFYLNAMRYCVPLRSEAAVTSSRESGAGLLLVFSAILCLGVFFLGDVTVFIGLLVY